MTALNNTEVFCRQAHRRAAVPRRLPWLAAGWQLLALVGAVACREPAREGRLKGAGLGSGAGKTAAQAATRPAGPRLLAMPECPAVAPVPGTASGGTLRVHLDREPPHLHPLRENSATLDLVTRGLIFEPLLERRGGAYLPALAQSWELSEDGAKLLLRLRPGVTWHDGRPLTAMDVQATLEAALRSTSPLRQPRASLTDVAGVEVLPDRTVRLRLKQAAPIVLRALSEIPIVPERMVRGPKTEIARLAQSPVGTGPFRFTLWERGQRIYLEANPTSWRGAPAAERVVFEIEVEPARALGRVRRGEVDVLPRLPPSYFPEQVLPPVLGERVSAQLLDDRRTSLLLINHRRPALQELAVRRALAGAWNRKRLAEEVHHGLAIPIGPSPFGLIPEMSHDLARTRQELERAGHRDGDGDGVRERGGEPLRFTLIFASGGATIDREARRFAQELGRAGITLTNRALTPDQLEEKLRGADFDLAAVEWHGRLDEDPRPLFSASGTYNHGAFRSPAIEALLTELITARPPADADVRQRLAAALGTELPVIFLYQHQRVALVSNAVRGLCHDAGDLDFREVRLTP